MKCVNILNKTKQLKNKNSILLIEKLFLENLYISPFLDFKFL